MSFCLLLPALAGGAGAVADAQNPFARPVLESGVTATEAPLEILERPVLRGLVVAGPDSIANLNGKLLAIGEEEGGYVLQSVSEGSATFLHRGEPVTLWLDAETAEEYP